MLSTLCEPFNRFSKMSAMACSLTGPPVARKASAAAPLPRPPQPIRARRIVLSSAACTRGIVTAASAEPAASVPLHCRNSRREDFVEPACEDGGGGSWLPFLLLEWFHGNGTAPGPFSLRRRMAASRVGNGKLRKAREAWVT